MPKTTTPEEVFDLYSGQVKLHYRDSSHRYRVSVDGQKPESCPSVTSVLGVINKPQLIEWGVKMACNYVEDNLRLLVSGDTFSVQQVFDVITRARTAHDRAREEAAEIGTNVHDWLAGYWREAIENGSSPQTYLPQEEKAAKCVQAAFNWFNEHDLSPISIEEPQYSRIHKFCGRPDWIGYVDGQLCVLDYKSTKFLYPELSLQLAAYGMMHEEMTGQKPVARHGLRLDKTDGSFEARKYTDNDLDEDTFLACLKIYTRLKHLRRKEKPESKEDWLAEV